VKRLVCMVVVALAGLFPARAAELSAKETRSAQELYEIKCAKCHKFYNPSDYSQPEWNEWMTKMSRKARLKPAQKELLTRYLQSFRERNAASK